MEHKYPSLAELAKSILGSHLSQMFGTACIKADNGKAAIMIWKERLVVKLPKDQVKTLKESGYQEFSPMEGRAMSGWICIPEEESKKWVDYARSAFEFVSQLEPNKKK